MPPEGFAFAECHYQVAFASKALVDNNRRQSLSNYVHSSKHHNGEEETGQQHVQVQALQPAAAIPHTSIQRRVPNKKAHFGGPHWPEQSELFGIRD